MKRVTTFCALVFLAQPLAAAAPKAERMAEAGKLTFELAFSRS